MRAAIVKNGVVTNIIAVGDLSFPVDGTLVNVNGMSVGLGYRYDGVNFTAPQVNMAELKTLKIKELRAAHRAAYLGGFTSSSLGSTNFYSTDNVTGRLGPEDIDRDELATIVLLAKLHEATPGWVYEYPCRDANGWSRKAHTAAQLLQVGKDGAEAVRIINIKLTVLMTQSNAATTAAELNAVVW